MCPEALHGTHLSSLVNSSTAELIKSIGQERPAVAGVEIGGQYFDAIVHRTDGGIILELEPAVTADGASVQALNLIPTRF